MESLRRRMKLLESRARQTPESTEDVATANPDESTHAVRTPTSNVAKATSSAAPASASPNQHPSSPRRRRRSNSSRKRSNRPRKRSRSDKIKRQLLLGYSLLIGTALLAVLVLMVFNLFGNNQMFGGGGEVSRSSGGDSSEEFQFEIESTPDLQELREALENAE